MLRFDDIELNNREPVYMQIVMYVKRQILLKKVADGEQLPSRREVAAQLSINPNTVQKAYKLMEDEGFVTTSGNQRSTFCIDDLIFSRINDQLTRDMIKGFIKSAKGINLSFKRVVDLISELWGDE
ncbi:MAG: hypothetical protein PWQ93_1459 [Clostridiales bacterium]|nr:hypothetical protein [Clostridiales bacterium]